jgi:hypothetical protein
MYTTEQTPGENGAALRAFAENAAGEPYFLAHALAIHRSRYGITEQEQRRHLGVLPQDWSLMQLCRCPLPEQWEQDLDVICERFGADRERLERVLKAGE